jgi:tetratricopeptide (TPR) repeat protein
MNLIDAFDQQIGELINYNQTADALDLTDQFILRAALVKAGINSDRLNNIDEAVRVLEWVMPIAPITGEVHANLASLYMQRGQYDIAGRTLEKAIEQYQENAICYFNYGLVCRRTNRIPEAAEAFRMASKLDPNCPLTHYQYGCTLLKAGYFKEGLKEFEWRFNAHARTIGQWKRYKKPRWDGKQSLRGKRVLVGNEQGQGDAIMLFRYIKYLKEMGTYIIMEVQDTLVELFKYTGLIDEFVPFIVHENDPRPTFGDLPAYDIVISLWSLMYHFDPELKNKFDFPYITSPGGPAILDCEKKKIGICWAGGNRLPTDGTRSCPLRYFKPLARPDVELFALQKGDMIRDWPDFENSNIINLMHGVDFPYTDLMFGVKTFAETAKIIDALDLVVSVDTAVAHLAGAMNKPTILLVSTDADWRWQKSWYPSVQVMQQKSLGDWEELMSRVIA